MHSRTASAVSISRDQAKVLNYGRIHGAGERFAKTLLMQFNHQLSEKEAVDKARQMYSLTKGVCAYQLNEKGRSLAEALGEDADRLFTSEELNDLRKRARKVDHLEQLARATNDALTQRRMWVNGTESNMFNKLEEIAHSNSPETPALSCKISRALEPQNVGKEFMTSRVNWVVQSSAVDYLHLMLVSMRHLFDTYRYCCYFEWRIRPHLLSLKSEYFEAKNGI